MRPVVVFPDAAAVVTTYLTDALTVHVGTLIPKPRPTSFVYVRRVGGTARDVVIDDATLAVECWAATQAAAHDLAQTARAELHALAGDVVDGVTVFRVIDIAGPADLPDPVSDQARYTFTVAVAVRGATA
jgi:hypothetical protein